MTVEKRGNVRRPKRGKKTPKKNKNENGLFCFSKWITLIIKMDYFECQNNPFLKALFYRG
jgi:hypothetical protein